MTTRQVECRFVVTRNGADFCELQPAGSAPTVRCSGDTAIKMSLAGEFVRDDRIEWLSDRIRPELIIDGVQHPVGTFLPASVRRHESATSRTVSIEAYDQCWILEDTKTEGVLHLDAGTGYLTQIKALMLAAGIGLVISGDSAATLAEDREDWEIGTSYLEIINQLLGEINYNPLWFNSSGVAILEPASVPTVENIEHVINSDDPDCLMLPGMSSETDIFDKANVFLCICSNPDKTDVMTATAENTNPQSELSIPRRGRRIVRVERVDNIADQTELQAFADRLRDESMIGGETFQVQTAIQPGHGVNDVIAFHHGEETSIGIETAWAMGLGAGSTMTHTIKKVVYNLG